MVGLYVIFAISIGIYSCIDLIPRVRAELFENNRLDDILYSSPIITLLCLLFMAVVLAPIFALVVFVPSLTENFVKGVTSKAEQ